MTTYNGASDDRLDKSKDYKWDEFFASGVTVFPERSSFGYTPRNQDGSSSCVAQTTAKMLEVWDYKHDHDPTIYSARPIYSARTNKPALGMNFIDALGHPVKKGTYLESEVASQNLGEDAMNKVYTAPTSVISKPTAYLAMPIDFYAVASEIDRSGAVMIWIKCSYDEWSRDIPEGLSDSEAVRHSICVVDKISWQGTEYLVIEDSWGTWLHTSGIPLKDGQRAITKAFFDKHCYFTGCYTSFSFDGAVKPSHEWKLPMKYGQTSDDIQALQDVLKYEKFFPSNQESTGYWGGITAKAVKLWQASHGILDFQSENDMTKIQAGPKTVALLNYLYK